MTQEQVIEQAVKFAHARMMRLRMQIFDLRYPSGVYNRAKSAQVERERKIEVLRGKLEQEVEFIKHHSL